MLPEKRALSVEEIEAQTALELPEREMPLVTIVIGNVLSGNEVDVTVRNVDVAANVCANILNTRPNLTCEIQQ